MKIRLKSAVPVLVAGLGFVSVASFAQAQLISVNDSDPNRFDTSAAGKSSDASTLGALTLGSIVPSRSGVTTDPSHQALKADSFAGEGQAVFEPTSVLGAVQGTSAFGHTIQPVGRTGAGSNRDSIKFDLQLNGVNFDLAPKIARS